MLIYLLFIYQECLWLALRQLNMFVHILLVENALRLILVLWGPTVNGILNKYHNASDISKSFSLWNSFFLPILMYAMESINLSISHCNEINSCWNSVYHTIYHFNKWNSVSELILSLKRLDFKSLYIRKCNFIKRLAFYSNSVISKIVKLYLTSNDYYKFVNNTGLHIFMSSPDIKVHLFDKLSNKVFDVHLCLIVMHLCSFVLFYFCHLLIANRRLYIYIYNISNISKYTH